MTDKGPKEHIITWSVLQDSVLGPLLCNVMYNRMLVLSVQEKTTVVSSADDLATVDTVK